MMFFKQRLFVEHISKFLIFVSFCVLIFAVLVQVAGRFQFFHSPVWTEELARFSLLYLVAFGVGLSLLRGELVNVDIIFSYLPSFIARPLRLISSFLTFFICVILIGPAIDFTVIGELQTTPTLGWRKDFIHASVLVLFVLLLFFSLVQAIDIIKGHDSNRSKKIGADEE
ncbi:MAG: TRAP-type C4-dicarboxylate transport system permease small subunit [Flavobacteriales bacterium]|jgi:TRAP-type C4-dicarboxylate transport system permease small subunit